MGHPGYGPFSDEYGLWQASGTGLSIEYSFAAMDEIRTRTLEGYHALGRGGIENGGLLFGRLEGRLLRVVAAQPFESEHAHGPSFVLSEADEESLKALLAQAQFDPALEGLEPAGWYVSHSRSGLRLSERDLDLHDRLFPEWWQVILVAVPNEAGGVTATFFARARNGALSREPAGGEFELKPATPARRPSRSDIAAPVPAGSPVRREPVPGREAVPVSAPPIAPPPAPDPVRPQPAAVEPPVPAPAPQPATVPPREPAPFGARTGRGIFDEEDEKPESRRSWRWLWWIPVALGLFVAGAILGAKSAARLPFSVLQASAPSAGAPSRLLGLRLREQDGRLQVTWNPGAVGEATRGVLEIEDQASDGAPRKTSMNLGANAVRSGAATYTRQGARVDFRLTVWPGNGAPVSEYASFVGPLPGGEAPRNAAVAGQAQQERDQALKERDRAVEERDQARDELAKLRRTTQAQATRISQLEEAMTVLRRRAVTEESLRRRGK